MEDSNKVTDYLQPPPPPYLPNIRPYPYGLDQVLPGITNQNAEFLQKIVGAEVSNELIKALPNWIFSSFMNKISALAFLEEKDEVYLNWQIEDMKLVALQRTPRHFQTTAFLLALNSLMQFAKMSITRSRKGQERTLFITNLSSATIEHRGGPSGDNAPFPISGNPRPSSKMDKLKSFIGGK